MENCFLCQNLISPKAKSCSHCGQPWPANYGMHPVQKIILGFTVDVLVPILKFILAITFTLGLIFLLSFTAPWFVKISTFSLEIYEIDVFGIFLYWSFNTIFILFLCKLSIHIANFYRSKEIEENDLKLIAISIVLGFIVTVTLGSVLF